MDTPQRSSHYQPDPTTRSLLIAFFAGLLTGMLTHWLHAGNRSWIFGNIVVTSGSSSVNGRIQG